jgi:hypothetical protein
MPTTNLNVEDLPEFEIVGLHHNSNGRTCCQHTCCGTHVNVGDVLRLLHVVVQVREGGAPEDAIKLVKIMDRTEGCCIAFVPRAFAQMPRIKAKLGSCCIVLELYDASTNVHKRCMSKRNYGVASCIFIDDIPSMER